jgi:deoxyribodipyrimidine photo-lyase
MRRVIWWVRRDLRVSDNVTLHHALRDAASVLPVFVLDPRLLESKRLAPSRRQFLFDSLADLDARLKKRAGRLILRRGDAAHELVHFAQETRADAVYFHRDYTPYARCRDTRVIRALNGLGVRVESFADNYLAEPEQVVKPDGTPYTIFTRYRNRFEESVVLPSPYSTRGLLHTPPEVLSLPPAEIVRMQDDRFAHGGETEALRLAREFMRRKEGLARYSEMRDAMALDATSHLSPHLHFGTISARELVRQARAADAGRDGKAWIDELIWREFYAQAMWHFPHAARGAFRREYDNIVWRNDGSQFAAWCDGRTGYPIVDAGMRQLNATGWMHNRARMIVASFLTKDLSVDWRWGGRYFMECLSDGDVASNNGGWQWSAGTGTDAQPFFRIFNPVLQGKRFDADGEYVRRWVPELARVPAKYIHAPWEMPDDVARKARVTIGRDYPAPIIDHAEQRGRALATYRQVRRESD